MTTEAPSQPTYTARLAVDYPDAPRNRLTTLFRLFIAIPIVIVVALVTAASYTGGDQDWMWVGFGGILFLPTVLMILFRQKYPRWWFDFNLQLVRFEIRVAAYLLLLRDEYPATDEEQSIHVDIDYPDAAKDLNRWLPLIKWLLALPHYIVLIFLTLAALFAVILAWFAILFTGTYPRSLWDFVVGVERWWLRVQAYMLLLVTDRYPPFALR